MIFVMLIALLEQSLIMESVHPLNVEMDIKYQMEFVCQYVMEPIVGTMVNHVAV